MRTTKRAAFSLLLLAIAAGAAWAQPRAGTIGVGVILGQPTGVSAKIWLSRISAVDVAAAWQFVPVGNFYLQADYLYHIYNVFPIKQGELPIFLGVGGDATIATTPTIGVRFPIGIEYLFAKAPLDAFLEIGLGVSLFPATRFQGSGGIGMRYDF